jgi:hypothetical protein
MKATRCVLVLLLLSTTVPAGADPGPARPAARGLVLGLSALQPASAGPDLQVVGVRSWSASEKTTATMGPLVARSLGLVPEARTRRDGDRFAFERWDGRPARVSPIGSPDNQRFELASTDGQLLALAPELPWGCGPSHPAPPKVALYDRTGMLGMVDGYLLSDPANSGLMVVLGGEDDRLYLADMRRRESRVPLELGKGRVAGSTVRASITPDGSRVALAGHFLRGTWLFLLDGVGRALWSQDLAAWARSPAHPVPTAIPGPTRRRREGAR